MVEIGIVKQHIKEKGAVLVEFTHLETERECKVLQPTTGANNVFVFPSIDTQVACWIEEGVNIVLGAIYSAEDKPPQEATSKGMYQQYGGLVMSAKQDKVLLKNGSASVKEVYTDIIDVLSKILVTGVTASGGGSVTFDPEISDTMATLNASIKNLFE